MMLLPVVERELRVAARERGTYRVRFLAALLPVLFSIFSLWFVRVAFDETPIPPRMLFLFLSWIAFIFVCVAGFALTCDSISQEKRDSTLGLLFLTDLKGFDIVLGKLSIAAIRGLYALIATVPVLALPLMMGGTNLAELSRIALVLVLALTLSMTVGIAVSSFLHRSWSAFGVSAAIIFALAAFLPGYSQFVRAFYRNPLVAHWIELPSPSYAFYMSFRNAIGLSGNGFEVSLGIILFMAFAALTIASLRTPRVWKDRPPARRLARFLELLCGLKYGASNSRARFRRRLLDANPVFWLSRREQVSSPGLLLFLFVIGAAAGSAGWRDWTMFGPQGNHVLPVVAWFACCAASHFLILLRLAIVAAERFGEDRRSGALELILSTPISIKRVLSGHWMGVRRYFAGPILLAFSFQAIALSYVFTLEHDPEFFRTMPQIFLDIFRHLRGFPMHDYRWERHFMVVVLVTLFPAVILHWTALAWLSTWRALREKHQLLAPINSLIILHLPPFAAFICTTGFLERFHMLPSHDFSEALTLYGLALSYVVIHQLLCIWLSRRLIYKHFRTAATDRYQPRLRRRWWHLGVA